MKTLKLIALGIVLFVSSTIHAQVKVNVNLGSAPAWGPAGYSNVDYYYLPDVQSYYDIKESKFIYLNGGTWTRSKYLPGQYRNYNLYNGYKVVLNDYHGATPYVNFKNHKVKYYKGYHGKPQKSIGYYRKNDNKYENDDKNDNHNENHNDNGGHKEGKGNNGNGKGKH